MSEIYWLTRLDSVYAVFAWMLALGIIFTVACTVTKIICTALADDETCEEFNRAWASRVTKHMRWTIPLLVAGALGISFCPTTKEALLIYGVGGSIDYLKENPTAQKLPDKVIEALDGWVDSWNESDNQK